MMHYFPTDKYLKEDASPQVASKKTRSGAEHKDVIINRRKSRPDAMAHFPFADDSGTITDVLHDTTVNVNSSKTLEMGEPARNRLLHRTFHEMRLDQQGIRMSDIPEAFSVCLK